MANEIRILEADKRESFETIKLYYVFDLVPAIFVKDLAGNDTMVKIKPTPYTALPDDAQASEIMKDLETALNAGDKMVAPHSITRDPGDTNAQLLAQAQEVYQKWLNGNPARGKKSITELERDKWRLWGRGFDG